MFINHGYGTNHQCQLSQQLDQVATGGTRFEREETFSGSLGGVIQSSYQCVYICIYIYTYIYIHSKPPKWQTSTSKLFEYAFKIVQMFYLLVGAYYSISSYLYKLVACWETTQTEKNTGRLRSQTWNDDDPTWLAGQPLIKIVDWNISHGYLNITLWYSNIIIWIFQYH